MVSGSSWWFTIRSNAEVYSIIKGSALGDCDESGLMVHRRVDRRNPVGSRGKAARNVGGQNSILSGIVQTLEESEHLGVGWGRLGERLKLLDDDVRVTTDDTVAIENLRCSVVVFLRVNKIPGVQVRYRHLDGKGRVGFDGGEILREDEFGGGHVVDRRNHTHGRRVAGPSFDLQPIGDGEGGHR